MLLRNLGDLALELPKLAGGLLLLLLGLLSSCIGSGVGASLVGLVSLLSAVCSVGNVLGVTLRLVGGLVLDLVLLLGSLLLELLSLAPLLGDASVGNGLVVAASLTVGTNPLMMQSKLVSDSLEARTEHPPGWKERARRP